ncbi:MAG: tetratricopeptide repeat protein [Chitinophagales bacterium]
MRGVLFFLLLSVWCEFSSAQKTFVYVDPNKTYHEGLELFAEKNYAGARERLERIIPQPQQTTGTNSFIVAEKVDYLIAVCAAETNDKDAESLLRNYFTKYHATEHRNAITFYLGKYYAQNNKYAEAAEWLEQVDVSELETSQIVEYKFLLAYSYFVKKKFDQAKPLFRDIKDVKEKYFYPSNYYYAFISFYQKDYRNALNSFKAIEDSKLYASVIPYYISQIYFLEKNYKEAITYINNNIDKSAANYKDEMNHLLGEAYFQTSDYAKALPHIEKFVMANNKVRKEDIYELGICQYKTGAYEAAIGNFEQINLLDEPMGQSATYALADCYLKTNAKSKARSAFQSAAAKDFDKDIKQISQFQYGKLSYELGYASEAVSTMETYLKENPKSAYTDEGYDVLVNALVLTKNYERAFQVIESLPELTPTLKEIYQRVTCYHAVEVYNDKRYEEVLTLCDKSLKYPISQELAVLTAYVKGEANYALKNYQDAIVQYQRFNAGMKPYMEEKLHLSEMRSEYNMAYAYFKQKRFREAKLHFSSALEQSASTKDKEAKSAIVPDLYLRFAECCFITKDYNDALGAYDKVATNNWTGAEYAQYQKGIVQGLQNKFNEKINTLNDLINKYPNSIYVDQSHYEIGETYLETDNNRDAIEAYNKVVKYYPKSALAPKAYLKTSLALYNLNKKEDALDHYKELIKKYPGSRESQQAIAAIKDLSVELGKPAEYAPYASSEGEKDSLNYQAGELAFLNNDCGRAIILFAHYKDDFPKGIFINEARYYRSECLLRNKQYNDALGEYKSLIENRYTRFYERALLNASGIAFYELKDTAAAYEFYKKLYEASSSTANTYTATLGVMRTSYHRNKPEETIEFADKIIYGEGSKEPDVNDAVYLKAKAAMALGKIDIAYINFNRAAAAGISARAAESKYRVAQFLFDKGEYKASLDTCFKMKNRFGSYEYWMVKDFILISDNYFALGNAFQAKATLESIIDNYKGDQALIDEAKVKLEKIRTAELNRSKIQLERPADQLQMDEDTIR